jgi:SLT domain-containing protein
MAQNPFEKALVDEGLVGTPLESLARSIYTQESSGGKNTKTSNAGAVGGMQILPGTFQEVLPGGDINNPYDNSRAGLRYIKQMYNQSGGDLNLTAAGYYGGPGGMQKAKQGVAVSDPRNPNAPTTLEYAKQVMARTDNKPNKDVSRETLKPESVIADAGEGYQAAYALMAMADEEPETEREIEAREAQEYASAAQQFSALKKQLSGIKSASPFADQGSEEVQQFSEGGDVAPAAGGVSLEKKLANMIGLGPAYETSVQAPKDMGMSGDEGTQGDAVRHMVLMREVSKKYGPVAARALGYGHEFGFGMLKGQSSRDREMDLDNNAIGLQLSKQAGDDEEKFKQLVSQALSDKKATYYRDEYKKPRKRAEGSPEMGEVSGRTFEEGGPETAKKMLKDVARGVSYYPYDLVGAPVDIINMGLKGVDYVTGSKLATEKPVGGSAYLIDKSNKLGIAEKPTGSAAEDLARLGSAFINPASGARATGRILEKTGKLGKDVLEDLSMATTGQGGSKAAQMLTSQAQPMFAVRPKGGVYLGAQSAADAPLSRPDFDILEAIENVDESTAQGKAVVEFLDKKFRKYVQTQQGTPDDPIFKAMVQGRLDTRYMGTPEMWAGARAGNPEALKEARRRYDANLGMTNIVAEGVAKERGKGYAHTYTSEQEKLLKKKIQEQSPGEDVLGVDVRPVSRNSMKEFDTLYDYPGIDQVLKETESGKLLRMLNKSDLPPHIRQAAVEGEPITYQFSGVGGFGSAVDLTRIKDYLNTRTPAEIKNMGVADVAAKTEEWHKMLAEARKDPEKFTKKQLMQGTETVLPASKDMNWVDVKGSDALSLEGNIMGHCVGGSNYCSAVNRGTTKIVSLRDKRGFPHVTIELTANDKGIFDKVSQVKGTANNSPEKYFQQIDEFLTDYSAKLGEPLRITERSGYLPEKWRK